MVRGTSPLYSPRRPQQRLPATGEELCCLGRLPSMSLQEQKIWQAYPLVQTLNTAVPCPTTIPDRSTFCEWNIVVGSITKMKMNGRWIRQVDWCWLRWVRGPN